MVCCLFKRDGCTGGCRAAVCSGAAPSRNTYVTNLLIWIVAMEMRWILSPSCSCTFLPGPSGSTSSLYHTPLAHSSSCWRNASSPSKKIRQCCPLTSAKGQSVQTSPSASACARSGSSGCRPIFTPFTKLNRVRAVEPSEHGRCMADESNRDDRLAGGPGKQLGLGLAPAAVEEPVGISEPAGVGEPIVVLRRPTHIWTIGRGEPSAGTRCARTDPGSPSSSLPLLAVLCLCHSPAGSLCPTRLRTGTDKCRLPVEHGRCVADESNLDDRLVGGVREQLSSSQRARLRCNPSEDSSLARFMVVERARLQESFVDEHCAQAGDDFMRSALRIRKCVWCGFSSVFPGSVLPRTRNKPFPHGKDRREAC